MANKFYITTAIPYVNAKPHIGHALEFVQGDVIARYQKLLGNDVLFLSGGDENALKNVQAAGNAGMPVQEFIDQNTQLFVDLAKKLNVQFDVFQKGSDREHHFPSSQKLWELCIQNGDIYKKKYKGLYCVGCELFYTKGELDENGECFEHSGKPLEEVEEENYFFRLSKYTDQILKLLETNMLEIVPDFRRNEVLAFVKKGLSDISISRSNERAKNWGVPVPGDDSQRLYVWFDALNIYQSGVGFGWNGEKYKKWWPADLHVIGKGIIRFHAVYWPAFLLSAHLELPKKLFVHEYFTVNGQKMSKTLGNVFDPLPLLEKYGADPLRYYCLAKISPFQDGDFSEEKFIESYNADLANGLGNLVARVAKLCEKYDIDTTGIMSHATKTKLFDEKIKPLLEDFRFNYALDIIWDSIKTLDQYINQEKPWQQELDTATKTLSNIIIGTGSVASLLEIAYGLQPFMPETAEKILEQFKGAKIKAEKPLFPRI